LQIGRRRFERVASDVHGSRRCAFLRLQSPFELGDPFERAVPSCFKLRGHQTVVGVDGFVASRGERRLVVGLLQLQRQCAVLGVALLLREVARLRGQVRAEYVVLDRMLDRWPIEDRFDAEVAALAEKAYVNWWNGAGYCCFAGSRDRPRPRPGRTAGCRNCFGRDALLSRSGTGEEPA
jgi:hypothetical protein